MKYMGDDINTIKLILDQCTDETKRYIKSQGCINNIIFYASVILYFHNPIYINNVDIEKCKKYFCQRHLNQYLENSEISKRYFCKHGDINTIYRNTQNIHIKEFIELFADGYKNLSLDMILYLFIANKPNLVKSEYEDINEECIESRNLFLLRTKDSSNLKPENKISQVFINEKFNRRRTHLKNKKEEFTYEEKENVIRDIDNLDLEKLLQIIDSIFSEYDLIYLYKFITALIEKYKDKIIEKIQNYLIKILSTGFFEEEYFEIINTIYKKMLIYNTNITIRKNNDKIIILISIYCPYFNKSLYIGNLT